MLSVPHFRLGWTNIGDSELLALANAIRMKQNLQQLW